MRKKFLPTSSAAAVSAFALAGAAPAFAQVASTTVTLQNEVNGYTGTFDRRIGFEGTQGTPPPEPAAADINGSAVNTDTNSFFIDAHSDNELDRKDYLIRFADLVGPAALPAGVLILDARLTMQTTSFNNSQSNGGFNIYRLAKPFNDASTASGDFGGNVQGLDRADAEIDLPLGTFDRPAVGTPISADVTKAVQSWVNGAPNLGFGVRSHTTDGWAFHTTGSATPTNRPQLSVTYTTQPGVVSRRFQQGVDGYAGGSDVYLNRGGDESAGGTVLGQSAAAELFLDAMDATTPDNPGLVRFSGLTAPGTGINAGDRVIRAELIMYTGESSANADTPGPFTVHRALVPIDGTTSYASLDSDGNTDFTPVSELMSGGKIGPELASFTSVSDAEIVSIDVTGIVQDWVNGGENHGLFIGAGSTNGWQIFTNGAPDANYRPELRIIAVPEPASAALLALAGPGLLRRRRRAAGGAGASRPVGPTVRLPLSNGAGAAETGLSPRPGRHGPAPREQ